MIRVNSQSGKGGTAYIMKAEHKMDLPRRLQIEFSRVIQSHTDAEGGEVLPEQMWKIFEDEYLAATEPLSLVRYQATADNGTYGMSVTVRVNGQEKVVQGEGNGPLSALWTR